MSVRALAFGDAAARYERFRFGYPDELIDRILARAGRPVRTALEIGAGTGKATRLLAARGVRVTATNPDPAMLAELRHHVPDSVRVVRAAFDQVPAGHGYDLVLAVAALHWTRPEGRWERVAGLLRDGGTFANVGGPVRLAEADLGGAVVATRAPWLASDDLPPPDGTAAHEPMQWPGTELLRSGRFTDVRQERLERRMTLAATDWIGHLSTVSAYLVLSVADRRRALAAIRAVLPERVEVVADLVLHTALTDRRATP